MKTSSLSSTTEHEIYFGQFISKLSEKFQPLQIFSFFKSSSNQNQQSCFSSQQVSCKYNYCLLLVTATATRIDYEVQDFANRKYEHGLMTIICHSNQSIWEAIDANSRFFKTIYSDGELLYSHDGLSIRPNIQPYLPTNAMHKLTKHYRHRMPLAEGFLSGAEKCINEGRWGISVFMLHQAVEQTCIMLIRVLLSYRSEFHNLNRLLRLLCCATECPYELFFETTETKRLFELLSKSYSSARYRSDFMVCGKDAESLYQMVTNLISVASSLCDEKIKQLCVKELMEVTPLPEEA